MSSQKIAKNTSFLLIASVGQKLLSFLYFTIVASQVGVSGSGKYFLATSFTTMFAVLVDIGLSNVLVREVAKNSSKASTYLKNVIGIKLIMAITATLMILLVTNILGYSTEVKVMIAIATVVMLLDNIHLIFYAVMRGQQNLRYEAVGVISGQLLTIVTGTIFIFSGLPLAFLIVALLIGSSWNVIWSWNRLHKIYGIKPSISFDWGAMRSLVKVTIPFALAGIFSRVYSSIDSVMLSKLTDEISLGWYGVAYKIAFAFQFLPMTFAAALYPAMSAYAATDREKLPGLLSKSVEYLFLIVAPIVVGIAILAEPLVTMIYGPDFSGTAEPLLILMISLVFAFLYWPAGSLLNATDKQSSNTWIMGATMVANIAANIILIPRFGAVGAAYSALIGNILLCTLAYLLAYPVAPFSIWKLTIRISQVTLSATSMGLVVYLLQSTMPLILNIGIGALTYTVASFIFGAVRKEDILWLKETFLRREKVERISDI